MTDLVLLPDALAEYNAAREVAGLLPAVVPTKPEHVFENIVEYINFVTERGTPPAYCPRCSKANWHVGSCSHCGNRYTPKHGGV